MYRGEKEDGRDDEDEGVVEVKRMREVHGWVVSEVRVKLWALPHHCSIVLYCLFIFV